MRHLYTRQLTKRYIAALVGVAVLAILGQDIVQMAIVGYSQDARLINIAGRQRMLSQRISKTTLDIISNNDPSKRDRSREELAESVAQWRAAHLLLKSGGRAKGNSAELERLFDAIEPHFKAMVAGALVLLKVSENPQADDAEMVRTADGILRHEGEFLVGMDKTVLQYQQESQARVSALQRIELILFILMIVVLALEGMFVFRPAVNSLSETIERLEESGAQLRREIDMHRRTEEVLRESEGKFKELAERSPVGIYLLQDGKFRYVNSKLAETFGYAVDDLIDKKGAEDLVSSEDLAEMNGFESHLEDHRTTLHCRFRGKTRENAVRFIEAYGSHTIYHSRPAVVGTWLDVTERKQAEEKIELASRQELVLREADRRKDEFLAMLAHELRNPLAAVLGAVQVLKNSDDRKNHVWAADVIGRQSGQFARLIDDLLDIGRITSGKIRLRRELIEAAEVLERACESVSPLCADREHELVRNFPAGELWLEVDPTRLEQVVVNLLTNSAKYSRNGGRIELSAWREDSEVIISVRDDGIGILPERLPDIFKLFSQGERSAVRKEGGLGIGLTIVKRLVEMHDGSINAQSAGADKGSTFTIRLPAARRASAGPPEGTSRQGGAAQRPLRILVVDDNIDMAQGVVRILERAGHRMSVAHDGYSAIDKTREVLPEVVLLDIGLPGMDGYEVVAGLRKEPCCANALIIALSGYGQEEDRRRSCEAGFDYHLVKPVDFCQLQKLLQEADRSR